MSDSQLNYILSAKAVREKAKQILEMCQRGEGEYTVHLEKLDEVADFVIGIIKEKYPTLKIPYHTRFNHFSVGGKDRVAALREKLKGRPDIEVARVMIDLVVTSVLLDAGAGNDWKLRDDDGHFYTRSEGLAVASYNMFMAGAFSSDAQTPLRADGPGLMQMTEDHINKAFQVSVGNPLTGVKGRAELLHKLGKACEGNRKFFGGEKTTRPGHLVDYFLKLAPSKKIEAEVVLDTVLRGFGSIWPGRIVMNDVNLGDTWRHSKVGEGAEGFVPFHKLSQWMTYSLLNPLEDLGFEILNLNRLTGLAEYRNGGLMLDSGLIVPKNNLLERPHHPDSKAVIEWRALTVAILDLLAHAIQKKLGFSEKEFPLAKVLEGGTWWAGRKLAQARGGKPPFEIISDGTVF
jgi:hypothetical protein